MRRTTAVLVLVVVAVSASSQQAADGSRAFEAGMRAFEAGDCSTAAEHFAGIVRASGDDALVPALHNLALSALCAGDLATAEDAAQRLAATDGASAALGDFLLGNVAWERCLESGALARTAAVDPFALDAAIAQGETARDAWIRAALAREDWPEARRNVERALVELADLYRLRDEARAREPEPEPEPEPPPPEEPEEDGELTEEEPPEPPEPPPLAEEEIEAILERLAQKDREKRALRRERRAERSAGVERDW